VRRRGFMFLAKSVAVVLVLLALDGFAASEAPAGVAPSAVREETQLPKAMHAPMAELPRITAGTEGADLIGRDNRVLQAAVDYVSGLGGGIVEIGEGEFLMYDSLHVRSNVAVRGRGEKTVLRKAPGVVAPLALDGDFGEEQVTVADVTGFEVGYGIAVWDTRAGGFHTTCARITGRRGNTVSISRPLMADCMVDGGAKAATVYPVISSYDSENICIEQVTIEGGKESNPHLNGCRGAGIFLYRAFGAVIRDCRVRNYNGDGISFQQSNDVQVINCLCEGNASLGIHPGSGSQRPVVRSCVARRNGGDGLFLCWRVRQGLFEDNLLEENGAVGISIGHKDSDNVLRRNVVRRNGGDGVLFRNESLGMAPHRNRLENNTIQDNGTSGSAAGIRVRGEARDLVFTGNTIRDTRAGASATQTIGIRIEERAGPIALEGNTIEAATPIRDERKQP
jgi:parallel beta-helix repeat protein